MNQFEFKQVDVFSSSALKGNPVAVVLNADGLSDAQMADFARWTNLSETTFVLKPRNPLADYRLRIFTTLRELPFAGHPTLGSCHAWLEAGGQPKAQEIVQECSAGLIGIRREAGQLAFKAPPLLRSGPVDEALMQRICSGLRIEPQAVVRANWVDNGPEWVAIMLRDRARIRPGTVEELQEAMVQDVEEARKGIVAQELPVIALLSRRQGQRALRPE